MINPLKEEQDNLKKNILESDVVSFDIFDTLVVRNVIQPTDVFKCIPTAYKQQTDEKLNFDFYKERRDAEMEARIRTNGKEDVTYDEIYVVMEERFGPVAKVLKVLELELETKFIVQNKFMFEVYQYALEQKKRILLVSDMYLPKTFLESLVQECGYNGYEDLIVSCEPMKTKHHGTIYPWVREKYGLESLQWAHVGDNILSDVQQANKNGVKGIYYAKVSERAKIDVIDNIEESIIKAIEINHEFTQTSLSYWEKFSTKYAAKLYFGITYWLIQDLLEKKKDNIYFIARDGYIIHHVYNLFKPYMEEALPPGKYLYASRRGYQYPEIPNHPEKEEAIKVVLGWNPQFDQKLPIYEVFENLQFDISKYTHLIEKQGLTPETVLSYEDGTYKKAQNLMLDLWPEIVDKLNQERENVSAYLQDQRCEDFDRINVFDVGWRGSIQKAIAGILNKPVFGYYFGTNQWLYPEVEAQSNAYAVNAGTPPKRMEHINKYLMIYEHIFSAPHGSLINFSKKNGEIVPNLENVECNENTFNALTSMHKTADAIIGTYLQYLPYIKNIDKNFILRDIETMLEKTDIEDMIGFSELSNTVGFGNSQDVKPYVPVVTLDEYFDDQETIERQLPFNLWPNALLITDGFRYFSRDEVHKLYDVKKVIKEHKVESRYVMHLKKMVKNHEYKYYSKKLLQKMLQRTKRMVKA